MKALGLTDEEIKFLIIATVASLIGLLIKHYIIKTFDPR
jgi:hypothetical protein